MQYRKLGRSGLQVSAISLGSWLTLGSSVDRRATAGIVARAYDLGINFFDTADVYANGDAEEALGAALAAIPRRYLVIASKCFFPMSEHPNDRGLSRKHVFESVDASLARLGTDYLDLHQCHRPDPETPLEETVRAYDDLIRQGKVLYWGVSEWSGEQISEACRIADATHAPRPISNQPQYNVFRRGIEATVLPACERAGVGQVVFSPLAQGVLSGKYRGGMVPADSRAADDFRGQFMTAFLQQEVLAQVEALRPLAEELGASLPQLALAWCLRKTAVASVIVGVTRISQLEDNVAGAALSLPDDVVAKIDAIAPAPAG
jgi:voltage-dependent potassium channel beta subunit